MIKHTPKIIQSTTQEIHLTLHKNQQNFHLTLLILVPPPTVVDYNITTQCDNRKKLKKERKRKKIIELTKKCNSFLMEFVCLR